ncbi:hypothetical protein BOX15_Mlig021529g1 [Macrostomum lignano]|uniref:MFS domain-containing protein n=1 Tax=Macrostomum lignano TaxID=282301 RepID=A0A267EVZ3_9PLAT|nr:hypothetical protein BOX15_Mlig021529g1 [Macrostomum lignano]
MQAGRAVTVGLVAVLLTMRLLQKAMEFQFIGLAAMDSNASRVEGGVSDSASALSWMYTCRYLLPVLGGLLACWIGHVRTLQLGGCVLLASAGAMAGAVYTDQWRPDSGATLTACALMLVYNGLVIPNVMYAVLSKRTRPQRRTVLCALVYMSSAAGLFVGIQVQHLLTNPSVGKHCSLVWLAFALAFAALAFLALPRLDAAAAMAPSSGQLDTAPPPPFPKLLCNCGHVLLPTRSRLKRSCIVFGTLIPFLAGLCDDRSSAFNAQRALQPLIANSSGEDPRPSDLSGGALLAVSLVAVNGGLVVAACCLRGRRRLPVQPRLLAGNVMEAALELALAAVSGVGLADPVAVSAVYTASTVVDATAAALTMVAAYELMDSFERDAAKPLIVGVMLTVWGLANLASRCIVAICNRLPPDNPILQPSSGKPPLLFVYHSLLLALLLLSLAFWRLFALRLARSLQLVYEDEGPPEAAGYADDGEDRPLLPTAEQLG